MNHQLQQLVAQTVTHFTSVNMLPINASNIPQNPSIQSYSLYSRPARSILSHGWIIQLGFQSFFKSGSAIVNSLLITNPY